MKKTPKYVVMREKKKNAKRAFDTYKDVVFRDGDIPSAVVDAPAPPKRTDDHEDRPRKAKYPDYYNPAAGLGIVDIYQSESSAEDEGVNVLRVELTDGTMREFRVKNGSKGEEGCSGLGGMRGPRGAVGAQGPKGEKGDKGDRGEQGPQGEQGEKGDPGDATMQDIEDYSDNIQTAYSYILQGRNLLRETNQGTKRWQYNHNGGEYTLVPSTEDDEKGIQLTVTKVGSYGFLQYDIHELLHQLEPNTRYSLGFDYKATSETLINAAIQNINASGQLTDIQKPSLVGDNTWHRCEVALTTNDLGNITNQVLYIYLYSFVGELSIRNLKFEKGSQETEWCPAPEDVIGDRLELTEAMSKAFDVVEQYVVDHPKKERITIVDTATTDEIASFYVNKDINGNSFLCERLLIQIDTHGVDLTSFGMRICNGDAGWKPPYFVYGINNTLLQGFNVEIDVVENVVVTALISPHRGENNNAPATVVPSLLMRTAPEHTKLFDQLYLNFPNTVLPIGTTIKVIGVKA